VNLKKLGTYAFLSRFYIGHHVSRLWRSRKLIEGQLDKFLDTYRGDRIFPVTPDERAAMPSFQACVSCGLCTNECVLTAPPGDLLGSVRIDPRDLAVAYSRSVPEFWSARDLVEACEGCGLCEEICPTDTPLKRIVRFIMEKGRPATEI
jgi:succinate dehydrogenase/fumarate reductase-like Fe-S protein